MSTPTTDFEIALASHLLYVQAAADAHAAHLAWMQQQLDEIADRAARAARSERAVRAQEATAAAVAASSRMGLLAEIAARRVEDRTSAAGAADVPRCVAEAFAVVAEVERLLAAPPPPRTPGAT